MPATPHETAGETAYRAIRGDIIAGRLAPQARLRLEALRDGYGASISTLRETLCRLSAEGLVTAQGQRGFEVAAVTREEFRQLAAIRELLEGHAMRLTFARGDLEWEGSVVGAHHKLERMEALIMHGDRSRSAEWKRYDREFHRTLISACGSEELLAAHAAIFDRYLRYQIVAVIFRGEAAATEHRALLDAALSRACNRDTGRDAGRATDVLHRHIGACVEHTVENGLLAPVQPARARAEVAAGSGAGSEGIGLSVGEAAWRRVRGDILSGRRAPRQKLRLDRLRGDYGVSINTLREILNRLTSEGLVIAEGQRGFEVAPVSTRNLREIAGLRMLIEGAALEDSFAAGCVEWEARVVAAWHKLAAMEARMASGDGTVAGQWKQYDWQFHQALISACGSQVLMQLHGAVFDKYLRYQLIALSYRGRIAAEEHRALLDCALRRDAAGAREVLERHLEGGMHHALATGTIAD